MASPRSPRDPGPEVSLDQVRAFRLGRHHLHHRAPRRALVRVPGDVAGLQAQLLPAAVQSLGVRVEDVTAADVAEAIDPRRALARAWCMRGTVHLVPSVDVAEFVRATSALAAKELRWLGGKGLAADRAEAVIAATLAALATPRTRAELAQEVATTLAVPQRAWNGGGWGSRRPVPGVAVGPLTLPASYLLHLARIRGVVLHAARHGGTATYVRGDAWLPRFEDRTVEEAERRLLRRYLRAYGPATPADFAAWSGAKVSDARVLWTSEGARIAPVAVDGVAAGVLREDLRALERGTLEEAPVRLLPYFDSFLMGHRSRGHILEEERGTEVSRPQGWIAQTLLLRGRVAGVWTQRRAGRRLALRVTPFVRLDAVARRGVRTEAEELARFLGLEGADVGIGPRSAPPRPA